MSDPKFIYLEPCCSDVPHDDRIWCQDDVWDVCDCGKGHKTAKYIRITTPADMRAAVETLAKKLETTT